MSKEAHFSCLKFTTTTIIQNTGCSSLREVEMTLELDNPVMESKANTAQLEKTRVGFRFVIIIKCGVKCR